MLWNKPKPHILLFNFHSMLNLHCTWLSGTEWIEVYSLLSRNPTPSNLIWIRAICWTPFDLLSSLFLDHISNKVINNSFNLSEWRPSKTITWPRKNGRYLSSANQQAFHQYHVSSVPDVGFFAHIYMSPVSSLLCAAGKPLVAPFISLFLLLLRWTLFQSKLSAFTLIK